MVVDSGSGTVGERNGEAVGDAVKISSADMALPAKKASFESDVGARVSTVYTRSVSLMVECVELSPTAGSNRLPGEEVASAGVGVLKRLAVRASQLRIIYVVHAIPPRLPQVKSLFRTHGSLPINWIGSNTSDSIQRENV